MERVFNEARYNELRSQFKATLSSMDELSLRAQDAKRGFTEKEQHEYKNLERESYRLEGAMKNEEERPIKAPIRPGVGGGSIGADSNPGIFAAFGQFLKLVHDAGTPGHQADERLFRAQLTGGIPSEGGFLVEEEFSSALLAKTFEGGQILQRVRRLSVGPNSNSVKLPLVDETSRETGSRWGGIQVYRKAELAELTESKPKIRLVQLNLKKLTGLCYASDEVMEDAALLGTVISDGFQDEFTFTLEDEITRGDGVSQMLGILNSPCLITVAKETGQVGKTIVFENLVNMWARLPARSKQNAAWFINQDVEPQLFTMGLVIGTGGTPAFLPAGAWSGQPYNTIFGRPVVPVEYCSTLGTKGDVILGDFSQYLLAEKGGLRAASSIHVMFKYDETAFRFILRNNGQPIWSAPRTPYQGTATVSPFVTLAARA